MIRQGCFVKPSGRTAEAVTSHYVDHTANRWTGTTEECAVMISTDKILSFINILIIINTVIIIIDL